MVTCLLLTQGSQGASHFADVAAAHQQVAKAFDELVWMAQVGYNECIRQQTDGHTEKWMNWRTDENYTDSGTDG